MAAIAIPRADSLLLSLQPPCVTFYDTLYSSTFLCGFGLTALLLIAHLIVAFRKRTTEWFATLLIVPLLCFLGGWLQYASWVGGDVYLLQSFSINIGCALIGLLNLLYGIFGLKPARAATRTSLPGEMLSPVPPLSETSEQQNVDGQLSP